MSSNKGKNSKPEITLRKALRQKDITGYRLNWKKAAGCPDIAFPGRKIAIFVNGCFWHRCPYCQPSTPKTHSTFWQEKFQKNIERDQRNYALLLDAGWTVSIVWECEIKKDIDSVATKILKLLE